MKKILLSLITILILASPAQMTVANAAETSSLYSAAKDVPEDNVLDENEAQSLPSSYSSKDLGYCSSVKEQLGDICWSYAALSSFETLMLKNDLFKGDFSNSALDFWGSKQSEERGWQRQERHAGTTYIPIGNFTSWSGPVINEDDAPEYGVTELTYLGKGDNNAVKEAIMKNGAVTANFINYSMAYSSDRTSYCLTDEINHDSGHTVSVIGWDDNYGKEHFDGNYPPKNDGAWLCKNSWGPNYNSIGGYLWISYEDYYLFSSETFDPSFTIDTFRAIKDTDYIYQNEIYGATYEFSYITGDDITYFNVFDFSENGNVLEQVVFETLALGADYKVYSVPVDSLGNPINDKTRWRLLGEGVVEHNGYISCDTGNKTLRRGKVAIAVEIDTSNTDFENCIGVSEWLRDSESRVMRFLDPVEEGKSYVTFNGNIVDIKDFYEEELGDEIGGALVIKAITNDITDASFLGDVNLDGAVDINDATELQKYLADMTELNDEALSNADFKNDGKINITDVTAIRRTLTHAE